MPDNTNITNTPIDELSPKQRKDLRVLRQSQKETIKDDFRRAIDEADSAEEYQQAALAYADARTDLWIEEQEQGGRVEEPTDPSEIDEPWIQHLAAKRDDFGDWSSPIISENSDSA